MDDPMFSGLGLETLQGPRNASIIANASSVPESQNMVAENARIMVVVPGHQSAEKLLQKIKMYAIIGLCIFITCVFGAIFIWFRKPQKTYEGTTLPGARFTASVDVSQPKRAPQNTINQNTSQNNTVAQQPVKHIRYEEDIVRINGPIPVWDVSENAEEESYEKRITENDDSILSMLKSREALTKDIEQFQTTSMKTTS